MKNFKEIETKTKYLKMLKNIPNEGVDASPGSKGILDWEAKIRSLMFTNRYGSKCMECRYESSNDSHLSHIREHVEIHTRGYYFPCSHCALWAPSKRFLRRHKRMCKTKKDLLDDEIGLVKELHDHNTQIVH